MKDSWNCNLKNRHNSSVKALISKSTLARYLWIITGSFRISCSRARLGRSNQQNAASAKEIQLCHSEHQCMPRMIRQSNSLASTDFASLVRGTFWSCNYKATKNWSNVSSKIAVQRSMTKSWINFSRTWILNITYSTRRIRSSWTLCCGFALTRNVDAGYMPLAWMRVSLLARNASKAFASLVVKSGMATGSLARETYNASSTKETVKESTRSVLYVEPWASCETVITK